MYEAKEREEGTSLLAVAVWERQRLSIVSFERCIVDKPSHPLDRICAFRSYIPNMLLSVA